MSSETDDENTSIDSLETNIGRSSRNRAAKGDGIQVNTSESPSLRSGPETDPQLQQQWSSLEQPRTQGNRRNSPEFEFSLQLHPAVDDAKFAFKQTSETRRQEQPSNLRRELVSQSLSLKIQRQQPLPGSQIAGMLHFQVMPPTTGLSSETGLLSEPESRPISQEQLVAEVKRIYARLMIVEARCIEVDNKIISLSLADPTNAPKIGHNKWQTMIQLHLTLLHEYMDFFRASQHPSAILALRLLASEYAIPTRIWRHGMHSFLEVLRHSLPESIEHMLRFIHLSYSMITVLYETVPSLEETWIEFLGDLSRYRMAIEDDVNARKLWTEVSRHWYCLASDKSPSTGRLYHHLAILAGSGLNKFKQVYYYCKSLCVATPFETTRDSILTLFDPALASNTSAHSRLLPLDSTFVIAQGLLFKQQEMNDYRPFVSHFTDLLDAQIDQMSAKFLVPGYQISIAMCCALLGWGVENSILMRAMLGAAHSQPDNSDPGELGRMVVFKNFRLLHHRTAAVVFSRSKDPNVLSFVHTLLVFLCRASERPRAMDLIDVEFPWDSLAVMLNCLISEQENIARIKDKRFPMPNEGERRPLPEDYALCGLVYVEVYPEE